MPKSVEFFFAFLWSLITNPGRKTFAVSVFIGENVLHLVLLVNIILIVH